MTKKEKLIEEAVRLELVKNKTAGKKTPMAELEAMIADHRCAQATARHQEDLAKRAARKAKREAAVNEEARETTTAAQPQAPESALAPHQFSSGAANRAGERAAQARRRVNNKRKHKATTNRRRHHRPAVHSISL